MKKYLITLINGSMVEVGTEIIEAKNATEAMIKYVDTIMLYDGDTLKIEEYENE